MSLADWYEGQEARCGATQKAYLDWYREVSPRLPPPRHIEWLIKNYVDRVISGECMRLMISMPPQHVKSDSLSRKLPVYVGERFPGDNVLLTGYSQRFAEKYLSEPARALAIERDLLIDGSAALDAWRFKSGGTVTTRGVGAPPTGIPRLKWIIGDDPIKNREEANSEVIRENIWQWWQMDMVQRIWPDTRVILIGTRWHEDDLFGRLLEHDREGWEVVNLPAIAEDGDAFGRLEGEALWPEVKPLDYLLGLKKEMGDYVFEALMQGNPTPRDGAMFKVGNITWVQPTDVPKVDSVIAFDDGSTIKGDFTFLCETWRCPVSGRLYQDYAFCQLEPFERNKWKREQVDLRKPRRVRGPQDPGAAGKESAQAFIALMQGYTAVTEPVSGDKEVRAEPFAAQVNAGMVYFVDSPGSRKAYEMLRQFPNGKHDDAVDAGTDSFIESRKLSNGNGPKSTRGDFF